MLSTKSDFPTTRHPIQFVVIKDDFGAPAAGCALVTATQTKPQTANAPNNPTPFKKMAFIQRTTRTPEFY